MRKNLEAMIEKQRALIEELKEDLVRERIDTMHATVPQGHCPSSYYSSLLDRHESSFCESGDCYACKQAFFEECEDKFRKELTEQIEKRLA